MKMINLPYRILAVFTALFYSAVGLAQTETNALGHWYWTGNGLPAYQYEGALPFEAQDDIGGDSQLPEDPYFLLGNHRLTLFTHVSGIFQLITAERVWARINASEERPNYGQNTATIVVGRHSYDLVGMNSVAADPTICQRTFGAGFACYDYRLDNGISCERRITVAPSETVGGGESSFLIRVTIRNDGDQRQRITYREAMAVHFVPMGLQMMSESDRPVAYPVQSLLQSDPNQARIDISARATRLLIWPHPDEASYYETVPPTVTMVANSAVSNENGTLAATDSFELRPQESRTIRIAVGLGEANISLDECDDCAWKHLLPDFSSESDEVLRREMLWNAYIIEASAKYSSYFDETFIPQGSVYSYHYGDNIANRDHLQALLPAIYFRPALAKSALRYVLKQTRPDGELTRGNQGFGYAPPTIYKESDQQIYMMMAVAEYLRITGDYNFLDETISFYPIEAGQKSTVQELLKRQFVYLRDEIGRGPNGLIRLQNSDWSDSFLHKHSPNIYLGSAESHLNSAMAMAVLPHYATLLRGHVPEELAEAIEQYASEVYDAYLCDLGDRDYSARAYLNRHLRFGTDLVCIEPHSYLLQVTALPEMRRRAIYEHIRPLIEQPESIGIRTRERSMWGDLSQGEDGGIWYALEYPLLLGVATFDCSEAWRLMKKFSFDNYATHYPQYWVGQWTAPDEINSTLYRPGLYAHWIPISNYRHGFEGYCSHPHSWPLYCYYKLQEIEQREQTVP